MKKNIFISIVVFLIHGNGYACSVDFSNDIEIHLTEKLHSSCAHESPLSSNNINELPSENHFCKVLTTKCVDYTYTMNSESKEHTNCAELFNLYKEMKIFGITSNYYPAIELANKTNSQTIVAYSSPYAPPIKKLVDRLQNINEDEYFSLQIDPTYFKGFGVRIRI